ncbi:hypothetical protein ZIOFF_074784 [Zingiber officinale]|uniref:DDE Tnp4 domain-containing protein n=1 Tax=Zingiber officinale TaxID=94328 RepID=A0A8J5BW72_ZINOF|nr:hypothetical protein ZIOFF_074784 [Zingiber officinale]
MLRGGISFFVHAPRRHLCSLFRRHPRATVAGNDLLLLLPSPHAVAASRMLSNLVTDSSTAPSRNATFKSSTRTPSLSPFRNSRLLADSLPSSACSWIALAQRCRSRLIHLAAPFVGSLHVRLIVVVNNYGLKPTRSVIAEEQLATFMMIVSEGNIQIKSFSDHNITHPYIQENSRYFPHFKDCIGAIDDTHIQASIPCHLRVPFIGKKGSAYDTRIFYSAIKDASKNFPCHIEVNII